MADEQPSLHIDTDWKKQAQEEKRKLAEQEAAKKAQQQAPSAPAPALGAAAAAAPPGAAPGAGATRAPGTGPAAGRIRDRGQVPQASFASLVQSLLTQVLFYLGDLSPRGVEPQVNLDMAKYNIDLLGVLEEKSKGNLTEEEQRLVDSALYESRMRYVSVASQYATV